MSTRPTRSCGTGVKSRRCAVPALATACCLAWVSLTAMVEGGSLSPTLDQPAGALHEFLGATDEAVRDAAAYLERRIATGSRTALQETLAHLQATHGLRTELSPDGATILFLSGEDFSRALITDGIDRPDWRQDGGFSGPLGRRTPTPLGQAASAVAMPVAAASGSGKADRVLLLFPHSFAGDDEMALQLKREFEQAGKLVTVVGVVSSADRVGGADVDTMRSLGEYGIVYMGTHGAVGRPAVAAPAVQQTLVSSGIPVEALPVFIRKLGSSWDRKVSVVNVSGQGGPVVAYTTEFFKDLKGLEGTVLLLNACHVAEVTGTPGGDLMSVMAAKRATLIGWSGATYVGLANRAFLELVGTLLKGRTLRDSLAETRRALTGVKAWLIHLTGAAGADNLHASGPNLDLIVAPPRSSPEQEPSTLRVSFSTTCTVVSYNEFGVIHNRLTAKGKATGPVSSFVSLTAGASGDGASCASWSFDGMTCRRSPGQPPSTAWSESFLVGAGPTVYRGSTVLCPRRPP